MLVIRYRREKSLRLHASADWFTKNIYSIAPCTVNWSVDLFAAEIQRKTLHSDFELSSFHRKVSVTFVYYIRVLQIAFTFFTADLQYITYIAQNLDTS